MTVVTPRSGSDLEYYLNRAGGEKTAGGYYLNAAQQGEPPGRWFGRGAEALGSADGQIVERDPYLAAYQQSDPQTGEQLGRAPNGYRRYYQILAGKLAAEPHATKEREIELEREAAQETRRSWLYTDMTVAHNKSISVLHASFREQARRARLAGDSEREALWRAREERVQEILQEANHAALEHLQEHAGFTRTGYHGRRIEGVEPGRWARAGLAEPCPCGGGSLAGCVRRSPPWRRRWLACADGSSGCHVIIRSHRGHAAVPRVGRHIVRCFCRSLSAPILIMPNTCPGPVRGSRLGRSTGFPYRS